MCISLEVPLFVVSRLMAPASSFAARGRGDSALRYKLISYKVNPYAIPRVFEVFLHGFNSLKREVTGCEAFPVVAV